MKISGGHPRFMGIATLCAVASLSVLVSGPAAAAQFEVIHVFTNGSADGSWPSGQLDMDQNGALYGTTARGGSTCPSASGSCGGTVYKLARPKKGSTKWRYGVLASFQGGTDGANPVSGIRRTKKGVLYGSTQYGGATDCQFEAHGWGCGTIFQVNPPAGSITRWRKTVLYRFKEASDGRFPTSAPIIQTSTSADQASEASEASSGKTTATTTTAKGGQWDKGVMDLMMLVAKHSLQPELKYEFIGSTKGSEPNEESDCAGWESSVDGKCVCDYGSRADGGCCPPFLGLRVCNLGGDSANVRAVRPFSGDGSFYGTTSSGGDDDCIGSSGQGCGVIYRLRPRSDGTYAYGVLYSFLGGSDGYWPNSKLTIGPDGSLYGTTLWGGRSCSVEPIAGRGCGTVFRLKPPRKGSPGGWTATVLYRFKGGTDGALPAGGVVLGLDGALYGATTNGGGCTFSTRGCGTIFKLKPGINPDKPWVETVLHRFQNKADGMSPNGPLTYDGSGAIYGTASKVVYRIKP